MTFSKSENELKGRKFAITSYRLYTCARWKSSKLIFFITVLSHQLTVAILSFVMGLSIITGMKMTSLDLLLATVL